MVEAKERIRKMVLSSGADLCGFASIDRFDEAPKGFNPTDIFRDCKTVISFAVALPQGVIKTNQRLVYGHFNYLVCTEADMLASKAAKTLEQVFSCTAVPVPCDTPYEYWDSEKEEGRGLLSMRHLAEQAGLGIIGKSGMLVNSRFGSMITIGAILTDLVLPSDAVTESACDDDCQKCIESCPANAINNGTVIQKLCREHLVGKTARGFDAVDCYACRTVCPQNS